VIVLWLLVALGISVGVEFAAQQTAELRIPIDW